MKDVKNHLKNVIRSVLRGERAAPEDTTPFGYESVTPEQVASVPAEMIGASSPVPKTKKSKFPSKKDHHHRIMKFH